MDTLRFGVWPEGSGVSLDWRCAIGMGERILAWSSFSTAFEALLSGVRERSRRGGVWARRRETGNGRANLLFEGGAAEPRP